MAEMCFLRNTEAELLEQYLWEMVKPSYLAGASEKNEVVTCAHRL